MDKELKALQALEDLRHIPIFAIKRDDNVVPCIDDCLRAKNNLNIIETTLKDYESRKTLLENIDNDVVVFEPKEVWEDKQKKLKALEIVKEKKWLVEDILNAFIEDKEKYNLLNEVFDYE